MNKRFLGLYLILVFVTLLVNTGCNNKNNNKDKIAYVGANVDSEYEKIFKELHLGVVFDYNFKLPQADKSWVDIWVEGYRNGKQVEKFPLTQLSYGLSPNQVEEGHMGFGIINPNKEETQLFLYSASGGITRSPHSIDSDIFIEEGMSTWEYAIGSEMIGLESGEEIALAVYRQRKESLRSGYDYQDIDSIKEMISENDAVLLLKIRVEEKK